MRLDEFYSPEEDQQTIVTPDDKRKRKLTLKRLNKLRKYRDIKKAEEAIHDDKARVMYAQAAEAGGI